MWLTPASWPAAQTAAVHTLVDLLRACSEAVRAAAAVALLDRGWGRPPTAVMVSGPNERPIEEGVVVYLLDNGRDLAPPNALMPGRSLLEASNGAAERLEQDRNTYARDGALGRS